jgi:BirA family biotin operon repressor/biotin-[acetyl-CoA-carboxylase] ligase
LIGLTFDVRRYGTVGSTNDIARELADAGVREGTLVLAREQTRGRGRHGRQWRSPAGNFYGSLILRPDRPLAEAASLSLVIALAALEACQSLTRRELDLTLKWPNDLMFRGGKIAGILLEAAAGQDARPAWVLAGLGVNLASYPEDLPYPATSLAEQGVAADPERFLEAYLAALGRRLPEWQTDGFAPFRSTWLAHAAGLGQLARLRVGDEIRTGKLADLADDGSILLENPMGCLERFTAGELFFSDLEPHGPSSPT